MRKWKQIKRAVALILTLTVFTSTFNVGAYANEGEQYSAEQIKLEQTDGWDGVTTEYVHEAENYEVTFKLTGQWNGGYNASVRINNTGNEVIHNWYLAHDMNYNISNIWNGVLYQDEEGLSIIKNAGWNQDILVDGYIEFGFSGIGDFSGFPTQYELITQSTEASEELYSVEYLLNSDWGSGFCGSIIITNNSEKNT